jgi:hypothetical protein
VERFSSAGYKLIEGGDSMTLRPTSRQLQRLETQEQAKRNEEMQEQSRWWLSRLDVREEGISQ